MPNAHSHLAKEHALILGEPQGVHAIVAVPVDGADKLVKADDGGVGGGAVKLGWCQGTWRSTT